MRRILLLIGFAAMLVVGGLVAASRFGTLAEATFVVDEQPIDFRIFAKHGDIYIAATARNGRSDGRTSVALIDAEREIGRDDPRLELVPTTNRVRLHVGTRTMEFDAVWFSWQRVDD